jgi:hypothetical protein
LESLEKPPVLFAAIGHWLLEQQQAGIATPAGLPFSYLR